MVTIEFLDERGSSWHRAGPYHRVHFKENELNGDGTSVARHRNGYWRNDETIAVKVRLAGSLCEVRFEADDVGEQDGPFERVELVDGAIYAQPGRVLLATLEERTGRWFRLATQTWWPRIVVNHCETVRPEH